MHMQTSTAVSEALAVQRKIITELTTNAPTEQKLENILCTFAEALGVKEALIYATVNDNYLEFMGGFHAENYKTNIYEIYTNM